jgi:5-aminopentanamidase
VKFIVGLAQTDPVLCDKETNLIKAEKYIRQAASEGANIVIFPELHSTGYKLAERPKELAEPSDGLSNMKTAEKAQINHGAVIMRFSEHIINYK